MSKLNIVILAAGIGKRMQSSLPKVLHCLAGKPLLVHVLSTARKLSPDKICIVYGYNGEDVQKAITDHDIIWVKQSEQLGTGHALMQALPFLDDDASTLVLFGDVPLVKIETLRNLLIVSSNNLCALLTANMDNPYGYGRIIRSQEASKVIAIVEEKDASQAQKKVCEINTGVMLLPNKYLQDWLPKLENNNQQHEYYLTDLISFAVENKVSIATERPINTWEILGVNSKVQLAKLERIYQNNYAEKLLEQGVGLADPERIDIRGNLLCGQDVMIDVGCIFEGKVILGDHVIVKANCILKDMTVGSGTTIAPFSLLEDSEVGENCRIGPYARIRPGTKLASKVHVGNFVELKNSSVAFGSKANHLSYIGDSIIGKNVNIGAGTITCNYDGVNKHQTIIEDNVFIGSDTQLVAPVKVTAGTTIGAGSTITRNTPPGQLSLSRSKQVSIAGWMRPTKNKV